MLFANVKLADFLGRARYHRMLDIHLDLETREGTPTKVFTSRCCRLISDQLPTLLGNAPARQRIAGFILTQRLSVKIAASLNSLEQVLQPKLHHARVY